MTGQQSPAKSPMKPFEGGVSSASAVGLNDDHQSGEEDSPDSKQPVDGVNGGGSP